MQSLRLNANLEISDLALRMPKTSGVIDPEPFRARARGEGDPLAEYFAQSGGVRSLYVPEGYSALLFDLESALLTFVISGAVEIQGPNRGNVAMFPGDIFLTEAGMRKESVATQGECRLIQILVDPEWPGIKVKPVNPSSDHARGSYDLNCKRMVKGVDGKSYFHDFGTLFTEPGKWSAVTPLIGFRFIAMAQDTFIDWHPEIVNNLVIVMSGALELEVGGGEGATEIFRQGDICLAEDRTGEGHIDRMHGYVQVAVLIVDDDDLWPLVN
jgi:hypothetical protein